MGNLLSCMLLLLTTAISAQEKIIENPPFSVRNNGEQEIRKIVLNNKRTEVHLTAYAVPYPWFNIPRETYLQIDGRKYQVDSATGLKLGERILHNAKGEYDFILNFPPIDANTEKLNLIESDEESSFKVWGVALQSKKITRLASIPENVKNVALTGTNASLAPNEIKPGKAKLKIQVLGYVPEMEATVEATVFNPVTGGEEEVYTFSLTDEGSLEAEVPLVCNMQVYLEIGYFFSGNVLLAPGKNTDIYIDLPLKDCQESRVRVDKCQPESWVYFNGAFAGINNEYNHKAAYKWANSFDVAIKNGIDTMNVNAYKKHVLGNWERVKLKLGQEPFSKQLKQLVELEISQEMIVALLHTDTNLEFAYRKKNKIGGNVPIPEYKRPLLDSGYFRFLKEMDLNNPMHLYSDGYQDVVSACRFLKLKGKDYDSYVSGMPEIADDLIRMASMSHEDLSYAKFLSTQQYSRWSPQSVAFVRKKMTVYLDSLLKLQTITAAARNDAEKMHASVIDTVIKFKDLVTRFYDFTFDHKELANDDLKDNILSPPLEVKKAQPVFTEKFMGDFYERYKDYVDFILYERICKQYTALVAAMMGTGKGLLFDLMFMQRSAASLEQKQPVSRARMEQIKRLDNPVYFSYLNGRNNELLAEIQADKRKGGYSVHNISETEGDSLLAEIIKPFSNKVVLIDFWNTWCSPCRSAIKTFEPVKQQYKDKDVVFIYLADESSPLEAWKNMIVDISGEHYRLNPRQQKDLAVKFGIRSFPSYLVLNRKAERVYFKAGFSGNDELTNILNEELIKK